MTLSWIILKLKLLMEGVISRTKINKERKSGARPTGGLYFIFKSGGCVNISLRLKFMKYSKF